MSIYDLAMIIILVGSVLFGLYKGLAWQVASLAAIFLSYFASMTFRGQVAQFISAEEPWNQFAAMLILFLGTALVVWSIFAVVKGRIREMNMGGFDRQAGAVVGAVQGGLLCMVVTMFAVALLGPTARNAIYASRSGGYIVRGINQISAVVPAEIHSYIDPYIANFNRSIVDPNGNLPAVEPIFGTSNTQQASGGSIWPASTNQNIQQPYGQQNQAQQNNGLPTSGQYSSGAYTQNPQQVPTFQGQFQTRPSTRPANNGGYANGGYQNQNNQQNNRYPASQPPTGYQNGFGQTAQNPPASSTYQNQYQAQPRTAGSTSGQASNGWPDINFQMNSKDLLERAVDGARQVIDSQIQSQR